MSGLPRRTSRLSGALALVLVPLAVSSLAGSAVAAPADSFPARIALPDGFQPEGITITGSTAWFGSRADGDIYQVSLRTGEGSTISEGPGTPSVGLKSDGDGRLYVAGGVSGTMRIVDIATGEATERTLTTGNAFINDVVLTPDAAWFTDFRQAQLYRVDRAEDGSPGTEVTTLPLTGAWVQGTAGRGANGISTTPSGDALLVVHSESGLLYRVDPNSGEATVVDTGGTDLTLGDGLLRHGRTLYVVRNRENQVVVLRLSPSGESAEFQRTITSGDFDVPTTVARWRQHLYLPNARFGISEPAPTDEYWVTRVPARADR